MKTILINAERGKAIPIGRRGENLAREVVFDISGWIEQYGAGTAALVVQRAEDEYPYPAVCTAEDGELIWHVSDTDTAREGYGACELRWYRGDALIKSAKWATYTEPALGAEGEVPEGARDFVTEMQRIGIAVQEAEKHAPKIGENGNWWLWDTVNGLFVDSGFSANGLVGPQGERGPQGYSGGATIEPTQEEDGFYVNDITGGGSTTGDPNKITAPENPSTGQFLVYNGTAWVAQTLSEWQGGSY